MHIGKEANFVENRYLIPKPTPSTNVRFRSSEYRPTLKCIRGLKLRSQRVYGIGFKILWV